ncbi:HAD-IC family P-type ATPase [Candidatus Saccharibacteria bacterium]|nr:HAD-IC family P-type ATPase [Candidatus Saccharibacteria bacterium]
MNLSGLSDAQVAAKIKQGRVNHKDHKKSDSAGKIILRNTLTIFNLVNLILAVMVFLVGSYKNLLFIFIAIANTLISIINEIRAKRTVDKMRLIAEQRPTVIRGGKTLQIEQGQIVDGDLLVLSLGDQILVDSIIVEGSIEVNESFVTGESDSITKHPGDKLISGSFIVSGACKATATAVGQESLVSKLESAAYTIKTADSKLFAIMNNIVKYISFALIPIGALLLWARFRVPDTTPEVAVTSTVAALINMIPEGLILLTSSVLALATIRLSRRKVLVQDLYSIETLARVDCIALDKTGTLTTGKMRVKHFVPVKDSKPLSPTDLTNPTTPAEKSLQNALKLILGTSTTDNATSTALKQKLLKTAKFEPTEQILEVIPFSSDRKYSGVRTDKATYLMGAPEFLIDKKYDIEGDYRILAIVKCEKYPLPMSNSSNIELLGYALLEDDLRKDAKSIIKYFADNDVEVKIISGDSPKTVQSIASKVGVSNLATIDLSTLGSTIDYNRLVKEYAIFTRVKPAQKKSLILALKKQGKTVAMTGDGVNDILAMKEADCSIAIGEGSDAARRSAKFVLLGSDFSAVPSIIDEGRQSINNLERSTTLFLSKTIYASILAVLFTILPLEYPYAPIEMSLLNFACIGLPGLVLALEHNTSRIKNRFVQNILQYSVPVGITISVSMVILSIIAEAQNFIRPELLTSSLFITFAIDFALIYLISRPLNLFRSILLITIFSIVAVVFLFSPFRNLLDLGFLSVNSIVIVFAIILFGYIIFFLLRRIILSLSKKRTHRPL